MAVRRANCDGYSYLCYDPHFVNGDGVMFYFHGAKGGNFADVYEWKANSDERQMVMERTNETNKVRVKRRNGYWSDRSKSIMDYER